MGKCTGILAILMAIMIVPTLCVTLYDKVLALEESQLNKANYGAVITFVLSARNLPSRDHHSKSDAFVEVYSLMDGDKKSESRFGTSSHVMDSESPDWDEVFYFSWTTGKGQKWRFVVRDHDMFQADDNVGEATLDVDDYVQKHDQNIILNLTHGGYLHAKKTVPIYFRLSARDIPNKDGQHGKSDPYIKIWWRRQGKGSNIFLHKTAVIKNNHNPNFLSDLIVFPNWQEGTGQLLYFQVFDCDPIVKDDLIGDLLIDADEFVKSGLDQAMKLENSDGKASLSIAPA